MPKPAKYTEQLITLATPSMAAQVENLAGHLGESKSEIQREALEIGLRALDAQVAAEELAGAGA